MNGAGILNSAELPGDFDNDGLPDVCDDDGDNDDIPDSIDSDLRSCREQLRLAPGAYARVTIKSRSTLFLRSGTYYMTDFGLEPQAQVRFDTASGPVFLYVRSSFDYKGTFVDSIPTREHRGSRRAAVACSVPPGSRRPGTVTSLLGLALGILLFGRRRIAA